MRDGTSSSQVSDRSPARSALAPMPATLTLSVITAVRNGAATIGATLDSLAAQDHRAIEHVVVDGASTDGTLDVLRGRGGAIARLVSERDSGVYEAFNKGVRLASGDAIGFLNCGDTYASPAALGAIAAAFAAPDVDAVFGDVVIVDAGDPRRVVRNFSAADFVPARLAGGFMPGHPSLFLRRRVYDEFGLYDPTYRIAGDFEHCVRVFLRGGIRYAYLPRVLVRMPTGGLSNRGWRSKWTITTEMRRACLENGVPTNLVKLTSRWLVKARDLVWRGP